MASANSRANRLTTSSMVVPSDATGRVPAAFRFQPAYTRGGVQASAPGHLTVGSACRLSRVYGQIATLSRTYRHSDVCLAMDFRVDEVPRCCQYAQGRAQSTEESQRAGREG